MTGRTSAPLTHEACTTCRQRKSIVSACGVSCRRRAHILHVVVAKPNRSKQSKQSITHLWRKKEREILTREEKPACLIPLELPRKIRAIAIQDRLTPFQQGYLQMEILQDLDDRLFQPRNLQPIPDPPNQTNRADLHTDVFKETSDECWTHEKG